MKLSEFQKVATMLAKEHRIKVIEGKSWAANIKNRDIFYKKEDIYTLSEEHILGLLLHEIAHIHYTKETDIPNENKELTETTLNMLEDIAIESIISNDYPNAGEILSTTKMEVLDTLIKILPKLDTVSEYEKALLFGATRFEGRGYALGTEDYERIGEKIADLMISRKDEIYLRPETKDLLPLSKAIVDLLIKEKGQPTEEDKKKMSESKMHGNAQNDTEQEATKQKIINSLKAGKGWKDTGHSRRDIEFIDNISEQANKIGKELRTILKRNNAMEFGGRYRSGKLMTKKLIRTKTLNDKRPFGRRIIKSNQSYAFAIASDVSGSMFQGGSNRKNAGSYALTSLQMVGEALKIANTERSLIIFGTNANTLNTLNKKRIKWEEIATDKNMNKAETDGTNIGKAIRACTTELIKSKAERKIMIVLTDGESNLLDMQEAHKEATKQNIEALGITIGSDTYDMDNTFSKKKNINIKDTKDTNLIGKAFIDILKATITTKS